MTNDVRVKATQMPEFGDGQTTARRSPVHWLIIAGVLVIFAIAIATAIAVNSFRQRALDNSKRELENTVLLLARHFDQQFQDLQRIEKSLTAHLLLNRVTSPEGFTTHMTTYEAHLLLKSKVDDELASDIAVLDADGRLLNWTGSWPAPDIAPSDRDFFRTLKAQAPNSDSELVQPLFSRLTGRWQTLFARRLNGPKGEFLGVVTRSIEPLQFEQFFASVSLRENSAITMFHRDGTMLARYPQTADLIGKKIPGALMQHIAASDKPVTMQTLSPVDGAERLGSVQLLREFPIALIATSTVESVLADWRSQTRFLVSLATSLALILTGLIYLAIRRIQRQNRATQAQMLLEKNRLDIAINNMTQGLLLFDAEARLVVCNQRYLDMYGLSRDVVKPGCSFRDVIAHRKQAGSFAGDIDSYIGTRMRNIRHSSVSTVHTADGRAIQLSSRPVTDVGLGLDIRLHHREFVAAEPRHHVRAAHAGPQPLGDALQQLVADRVAERVVDALELVDVDIHHRALRAALHPF